MVKQWKKTLDDDDVQAGAENALEKDIANLSPASNSVAENLDGGISGGTSWPNLEFEEVGASVQLNASETRDVEMVSGSGILFELIFTDAEYQDQTDIVGILLDGDFTSYLSAGSETTMEPATPLPFSSSLEIRFRNNYDQNERTPSAAGKVLLE